MIAQKDSLGCGVAAVANILNIDYYKALKLFDNRKDKAKATGFLCREIVQALNKAGKNYCYKYIKGNIKKNLYKQGTIVFIKRSKHYPYGHYLARINGRWIDPWINFKRSSSIKEAKAGIRKRLPAKPIYEILPM